MDLRQLRYFIAIVEQGSFSQAASFLNIAQPALSLHVRNMETALGTPLLYRSPKGVTPTEAGEILLRNARIILNQLTIAEEEIRGHDSDPVGVVRVGLPGTISEILSVPLIVAAHRRFPHIRLRLAEAMSGFVAEWLTEARIDLALLYNQAEGHTLTLIELLEEELVFFCRSEDAAGLDLPPPGTALGFDRLAEIPLIVPGQAHGLRMLLGQAAEARRAGLTVAIEVDSYSNIKELVKTGFGCSILPLNAIKREVAAGEMRCWSIGGGPLSRSVYLAHSDERPMTNAVTAIHRLIQDVLRDLLMSGTWAGASAPGATAAQDLPEAAL